jgi:hypothetical protein
MFRLAAGKKVIISLYIKAGNYFKTINRNYSFIIL